MKKLGLIRHAKASWEDFSQSDHDRPLDKRGIEAAQLMGQRLLQKELTPDLVVHSTAARATATAKLIAAELGLLDKLVSDGRIYEAGVATLLNVIRGLDDQFEYIVLVGHNPGFTMLVNHLQDDNPVDNMPTCATALLSFDVNSWGRVESGKLLDYDYPKR